MIPGVNDEQNKHVYKMIIIILDNQIDVDMSFSQQQANNNKIKGTGGGKYQQHTSMGIIKGVKKSLSKQPSFTIDKIPRFGVETSYEAELEVVSNPTYVPLIPIDGG